MALPRAPPPSPEASRPCVYVLRSGPMPLAHSPTPMAVADFLAWEETQELRWEFDGFAPIPKVGDTEVHEAIRINLVTALHAKLRGRPYRVHGCSLKVRVAGRIRYPDAFIARPLAAMPTYRRPSEARSTLAKKVSE